MEFSVMPMSEASFEPPPFPPSSLLPPQAARVEATVAAVRTVTSRREDLDNGSPLVRPGLRCPGVGKGASGRDRRIDRSSPPGAAGGGACGASGAVGEPAQPEGPDEAGRGEDHRQDQDDAV